MPCRAGTPLLHGTCVPCSVRPGCSRCVPRLSSCRAAQATARPSMTSSACEPRSWWRCPQTQRCPRTQRCCRSGALRGSVPSAVLPAWLAGERDVVVPWRGWEGRGHDSGVTPCAWAHLCAHGSWPHTVPCQAPAVPHRAFHYNRQSQLCQLLPWTQHSPRVQLQKNIHYDLYQKKGGLVLWVGTGAPQTGHGPQHEAPHCPRATARPRALTQCPALPRLPAGLHCGRWQQLPWHTGHDGEGSALPALASHNTP